ncbi:hypothetical protein ACFV3R_00140 [Streptomyces sp. NPDC059740]|uniref:hypothetical protein n=1 Tax=Streptomyces sp. NPDC059740 TaxID=3346926 RepID=UPI0036655150
MPTPYGNRGGLALSADELRVVRRALSRVLTGTRTCETPTALHRPRPARAGAREVRECLDLAEALDTAADEGRRLRRFQRADLDRHRAALPGAALGYLDRLQEALAAGYLPVAADLVALRTLTASDPAGGAGTTGPEGARGAGPAGFERRRSALLRRCEAVAERSVRVRLRAVPGGRGGAVAADGPERDPRPSPPPAPAPRPEPGTDPGTGDRPQPPRRPTRPVPTPGEVFPPRRKPAAPPGTRPA